MIKNIALAGGYKSKYMDMDVTIADALEQAKTFLQNRSLDDQKLKNK